jgi:hypothetical protein
MGGRPAFDDDIVGWTGTFSPGHSTLVVTVYQFDGSTSTVLDQKSASVTLAAGPTVPYITGIKLNFTSLVIDGAPGAYTVSIWNPGATESIDAIRGDIFQGTTSQGAGGGDVLCDNNPSGVLPHGVCTLHQTASASNSGGGTGALVPGTATLQVGLVRNTTTVLDKKQVGITLTNQ